MVENTGLTMCLELMNNMAETDPQTSSIFFREFYIPNKVKHARQKHSLGFEP
jgi:hypothetical protein